MTYTLKSSIIALALCLPTASVADWTGPYGGLAFGTVTAEIDFGNAAGTLDFSDTNTVSGFGGYLLQQGTLVYGGEIAFGNAPDANLGPNADLKPYTDLKGRVGYIFGDALAYGVLGVSFVNYDEGFNLLFEGRGLSVGAGVDYMVTDSVFIGAEYLMRQTSGDNPNGLDTEFDLNVDTFSLRAGYKF